MSINYANTVNTSGGRPSAAGSTPDLAKLEVPLRRESSAAPIVNTILKINTVKNARGAEIEIRAQRLPEELKANFHILAPVYNEEREIRDVIKACRANGTINMIIFVDDGSSDRTPKILAKEGVFFISFKQNQHKESSLETALRHMHSTYGQLPPYIVTFDGGDSTLISADRSSTVIKQLNIAVDRLQKLNNERPDGKKFVAQPIHIQAWQKEARESLLFHCQSAFWWLDQNAKQLSCHLKPKGAVLDGGAQIFRTPDLLKTLENWQGNFANCNASRFTEAVKERGCIAAPLRSVRLNTGVMATWSEWSGQRARWMKSTYSTKSLALTAVAATLAIDLAVLTGIKTVIDVASNTLAVLAAPTALLVNTVTAWLASRPTIAVLAGTTTALLASIPTAVLAAKLFKNPPKALFLPITTVGISANTIYYLHKLAFQKIGQIFSKSPK